MSYIDGFVAAAPSDGKEAYLAFAKKAAELFKEYGAVRVVENWGDDVPEGKTTDFRRAVAAREGQTVVFSWIEWPDKATRDAGQQKMMTDERFQNMGDMPFDGPTMIYGGFTPIMDE